MRFHEVGEHACVGGEASKGEADVFVYGNYFLLVGGELFCIALGAVSFSWKEEGGLRDSGGWLLRRGLYLQCYEDGVCLADYSYDD